MIKPRYIIVPLLVLGVALLGQYFTGQGMSRYLTLHLPSLTPPGWIIGIIWTIIFILSVVSVLLFWKSSRQDRKFGLTLSLYVDNAILNILRSWLFFVKHRIFASIVEMIVLWIITVMLIFAVFSRSKLSAYLLVPYALWLIIATVFAINIYLLN